MVRTVQPASRFKDVLVEGLEQVDEEEEEEELFLEQEDVDPEAEPEAEPEPEEDDLASSDDEAKKTANRAEVEEVEETDDEAAGSTRNSLVGRVGNVIASVGSGFLHMFGRNGVQPSTSQAGPLTQGSPGWGSQVPGPAGLSVGSPTAGRSPTPRARNPAYVEDDDDPTTRHHVEQRVEIQLSVTREEVGMEKEEEETEQVERSSPRKTSGARGRSTSPRKSERAQSQSPEKSQKSRSPSKPSPAKQPAGSPSKQPSQKQPSPERSPSLSPNKPVTALQSPSKSQRSPKKSQPKESSFSSSDEPEPEIRKSSRNQQPDEPPAARTRAHDGKKQTAKRSAGPPGSKPAEGAKRRPGRPRKNAPKPAEEKEEDADDEGPAKRTRAYGSVDSEGEEEIVYTAPEAPTGRRSKKPAGKEEVVEDSEEERTGKKAPSSSSSSSEEEEEGRVTRGRAKGHPEVLYNDEGPKKGRARRGRGKKAKQPEPDSDSDKDEPPARTTRSHSTGAAAKRATRSQPETPKSKTPPGRKSEPTRKSREEEVEESPAMHTRGKEREGTVETVESEKVAEVVEKGKGKSQSQAAAGTSQAAAGQAQAEEPERRIFERENGEKMTFFLVSGPQKNAIAELIRQNGGRVELTEIRAEFRLVPDNYINNTSRPATSFLWVSSSVDAGRLLNQADFRIAPSAPSPQRKTTRTEFSAEDDSLIIRLAKAGKLGTEKGAGNRAFAELAEAHPHHTMHSWRERWVRHIQPQVGRKIEKQRKEERDRENREKLKRGEEVVESESSSEEEEEGGRRDSFVPRKRRGTRVEFTKDDDDLLIETLNEPGKKNTLGNKIFQELADKYPHHTWQSWRNRWAKKLVPQLREREELVIEVMSKRERGGDAEEDEEDGTQRKRRKTQEPSPSASGKEEEEEEEVGSDAEMQNFLDAAAAEAEPPAKPAKKTPVKQKTPAKQKTPVKEKTPVKPPSAKKSPAKKPQEDVEMDGDEESDDSYDYSYYVISEDEISESEYNDVHPGLMDLANPKELKKALTPKKADVRTSGRPPAGPSQAAARPASQTQRPASRPGNENAASGANARAGPSTASQSTRPTPLANEGQLYERILKHRDQMAITALHMASGKKALGVLLYNSGLRVDALAPEQRREVFTEAEDNLIKRHTDEEELLDLYEMHGGGQVGMLRVQQRASYLDKVKATGA